MNFLAHAHLAGSSDLHIVGSVLGEFIKGPDLDRLHPDIGNGVMLHRKVDVFVDRHQFYTDNKSGLSGLQKRFAGIVLDIYCDHLLIRHWHEFADVDFFEFSRRVYNLLQQHDSLLPARYRTVIHRMVDHDWFAHYQFQHGIEFALRRLEKRIRRPVDLVEILHYFISIPEAIDGQFQPFYSELHSFSEDYILNQ